MVLADGKDNALQVFAIRHVERGHRLILAHRFVLGLDHAARQLGIFQRRNQILKRCPLLIRRCTEDTGWFHKIIEVAHSIARRRVELRVGFCTRLWRVTFDKAPKALFVF